MCVGIGIDVGVGWVAMGMCIGSSSGVLGGGSLTLAMTKSINEAYRANFRFRAASRYIFKDVDMCFEFR